MVAPSAGILFWRREPPVVRSLRPRGGGGPARRLGDGRSGVRNGRGGQKERARRQGPASGFLADTGLVKGAQGSAAPSAPELRGGVSRSPCHGAALHLCPPFGARTTRRHQPSAMGPLAAPRRSGRSPAPHNPRPTALGLPGPCFGPPTARGIPTHGTVAGIKSPARPSARTDHVDLLPSPVREPTRRTAMGLTFARPAVGSSAPRRAAPPRLAA